MKNAVLVFGAFDPITNAHINIGKKAKEAVDASIVLYVPCHDNFIKSYKKTEKYLDNVKRTELLNVSIKHVKTFFSDLCEINEYTNGTTYNTLQHIKDSYRNIIDEYYICIGSDKLNELSKWYNFEKLVSENKFIVIMRNKDKLKTIKKSDLIQKYPERFVLIDNKNYLDISSTDIRKAYNEKNLQFIKENVPEPVYNYLERSCNNNVNLF